MDRAYVEQFNKYLIDGTPVEEDAKVLIMIGDLNMNIDLWKVMHQQWPEKYIEFRKRAAKIMRMQELLAQLRTEQEEATKNVVVIKKPVGRGYKIIA